MPEQSVLLHLCCGPCSIVPVQSLQEQGFKVVGLFYNPNIHPLQEYLRRREGVRQAAERLSIQVIFKDDEYDPGVFFRQVAFRESSRCLLCSQLRLERTLSIAKRGGFDFFSTSLLYSRQQKHDSVAGLARDMAGDGRVRFFYQDFRPGWRKGIEISQDWGLYRQQYCGCVYSEVERYRNELRKLG
jgi:hypothetical protein